MSTETAQVFGVVGVVVVFCCYCHCIVVRGCVNGCGVPNRFYTCLHHDRVGIVVVVVVVVIVVVVVVVMVVVEVFSERSKNGFWLLLAPPRALAKAVPEALAKALAKSPGGSAQSPASRGQSPVLAP